MEASVVRYVLIRESPIESHPRTLLEALTQTVVGQREALEALMLGLIADGHVLLEGPPGIAKTLACRALAAACDGSFKRIQFTPDLMPSDITGMRIFDPRTAEFAMQFGPIFANIVLTDEINRAPAKVQSALLEAMQERQVTIGIEGYTLPDPFLVLATMNPYDSDGTYTLPFAQMDRFLLNVCLHYPSREEELQILQRFSSDEPTLLTGIVTLEDIRSWRAAARGIAFPDDLCRYVVKLVLATRPQETLPPDLRRYVHAGAGPRATLALAKLSRARAFLGGRTCVEIRDIQNIAINALHHRIAFSYRTQSESVDVRELTRAIVASVIP